MEKSDRGKLFEKLVSWIHICLADKGKVIPNDKIVDKDSGNLRQIDIAIYLTDGPYTTLTIVELRDHKRPIGSQYLEEIKGKKDSVGADAAAVVSKSGFTKPAMQKAKSLNIRALTYDEALQGSWVQWATMKTLHFRSEIFQIKRVDFEFHSPLDEASTKDFAALSDTSLQPSQVKFQLEGGGKQLDVNSLVQTVLDQNPPIWDGVKPNTPGLDKKCTIVLNTEPPIRFLAGASMIPVKAIILTINLKIVEEERPLEYSALKNTENGTSIADILSAKIPYGSAEAKLNIMTKGNSKFIEAGQKIFFSITKK